MLGVTMHTMDGAPSPEVPMLDVSTNLAASIRALRALRGHTQQQLAKLSGVPRPTIATLESGGANPTLAVLTKVAAALQVTIEELLSPPRATARHFTASELPAHTRGKVQVRQLLPDVVPGVIVERLELPAGAHMSGTPHKAGTREYLCCESGALELVASGAIYRLAPGDVVVFRGDQRHGYSNPNPQPAVAYSVVLPTGR